MSMRTFLHRLSVVTTLCTMALFPFSTWAQSVSESPSTSIGGYSRAENEFVAAVVMRPGTHEILYAYQPDMIHPAASLTKLTNALAFVDGKPNWKKLTTITKQDEVGGGRLRVTTREKITIQDLFYSSITSSANNAANALARVSGKTKAAFLALMNAKAKQAGATHTKLVDFSGMNTKNVTTARDMALIGERAYANPFIQRAASVPTYHMTIVNTGREKVIKNTNHLLTSADENDVYVVGGKTGYLVEAGNNLVVQLRPVLADGTVETGKDLVVVVFGSQTKEQMFASAKRLAMWGFSKIKN